MQPNEDQPTGDQQMICSQYCWWGDRYSGEAVKLKNLSSLRHVEEHTVSISPDGTEIVIALGRSLTLDASHMVPPRPTRALYPGGRRWASVVERNDDCNGW